MTVKIRAVNWYDLLPGDNIRWYEEFATLLKTRNFGTFATIADRVYVCYSKETDRIKYYVSFSQVFDIEVKTNNAVA